jgi:hypothetical protein
VRALDAAFEEFLNLEERQDRLTAITSLLNPPPFREGARG